MNRRKFVKLSGAIAAGSFLSKTIFAKSKIEEVKMEYKSLNNGLKMPVLGFGTYLVNDPQNAPDTVCQAINSGFRLIDTAAGYGNEEFVGEGIRKSGIERSQLFIISKVWIKDASYSKLKSAFELSLKKLGTDYLDLYLIHQPYNDVCGAWRAMSELYKEGRIRAIGVSNFVPDRIADFALCNEVVPALNQIEANPFNQKWDAQKVNKEFGIQSQAWSPLCQGRRPDLLTNPVLAEIGKKHGKTPAQICLRWNIQRGFAALVKTVHKERMSENLNIFDFALDGADMEKISKLDERKAVIFEPTDPEKVKWLINM